MCISREKEKEGETRSRFCVRLQYSSTLRGGLFVFNLPGKYVLHATKFNEYSKAFAACVTSYRVARNLITPRANRVEYTEEERRREESERTKENGRDRKKERATKQIERILVREKKLNFVRVLYGIRFNNKYNRNVKT